MNVLKQWNWETSLRKYKTSNDYEKPILWTHLETGQERTWEYINVIIFCLYYIRYKMTSMCPKCECKPSNADKWRYTLLTTLIFLIVVNPMTYQLTQKLFGNVLGNIANACGCPTYVGIAVHAVVFTLILRYTMDVDIWEPRTIK